MNYRDSIKEGDGNSDFNSEIHVTNIRSYIKNYAIEAFHTLLNCKLLPPRQAHQLVWSRFINVCNNTAGCNIPCDLHNEHLNRMCKDYVKHLGANKTEKAIS